MVQLTIDTEKDSPEHLRKVIQFLESLVGQNPQEPMPNYSTPEPSGDMFSMFDQSSSTPKSSELKTPEQMTTYSTSELLSQNLSETEEDGEPQEKNFFSLMEY